MTPIQQEPNRSGHVLFLCLFVLFPIVSIHGQSQSEVAPPAKSDTYAVTVDGKKLRVQHREIEAANFRISGVDLASKEEVLQQATRLFGKSTSVSSGDASTSYEEVCYQSATENDNTHLIFGRGEVDSSLILSSDSSVWKGNQICTRSGKITRNIATDSGLHLGLTQAQVIAILGLATRHSQDVQQHRNALIYSIESKKKQTESSTFYYLEVGINAQFVDDSLTRLTISWSLTD
jgi:hypothetical protein